MLRGHRISVLLPTYPPNQSDTESCQLYPPHCSDPPFLLSSRSLASVWPFASHLVSWSLYQTKPCLEPQSEPCPQIADQRECSDLRILPLLDWASEQKLSSGLPPGTQIWELEMGSGSQELTQLEHIHRGWGKLCPKGNKT